MEVRGHARQHFYSMIDIKFSTKFPATHPRKGEVTNFVAKILKYKFDNGYTAGNSVEEIQLRQICNQYAPKLHTIRAGERWKVGDVFAPKIWSGRPYYSTPIQFAPPITIQKIWAFEYDGFHFKIDGKIIYGDDVVKLAANDGLTQADFAEWFNKPFSGQIICWDKNLDYSYMINP